MKKKWVLLIATVSLTLASVTNAFGYNIVIEGEEKTGKSYPTVTKSYYDYGDNGEEIYYDVTVHQIPKTERFKVTDYDITDSTYISYYSIVFGNRCDSSGSGINGGCAFLYDCFDSHTLKDEYHDFKNIDYKPSDWLDEGCFFTVDDVNYQNWDYISDIEPEPFFFQFANVPLLKPDETEEPDKPIASDSNATDSNASHGSGGGSSSGGSSRKAVTKNSSNMAGTWIQDEKGWWFKKIDGSYPKNEWIMNNDIWYHFDENGYMQTGWLIIENTWYFLKPDGAMVSNDWSFQDGKWYYFDTSGVMQTSKWIQWKEKWYYVVTDGSMLTDTTTPDGYKVGLDGEWIQ